MDNDTPQNRYREIKAAAEKVRERAIAAQQRGEPQEVVTKLCKEYLDLHQAADDMWNSSKPR